MGLWDAEPHPRSELALVGELQIHQPITYVTVHEMLRSHRLPRTAEPEIAAPVQSVEHCSSPTLHTAVGGTSGASHIISEVRCSVDKVHQ